MFFLDFRCSFLTFDEVIFDVLTLSPLCSTVFLWLSNFQSFLFIILIEVFLAYLRFPSEMPHHYVITITKCFLMTKNVFKYLVI